MWVFIRKFLLVVCIPLITLENASGDDNKIIFKNNNSPILQYEFYFDRIIIRKIFNEDEFTKKRTDFKKYEIMCWGKGYWTNLTSEAIRYPVKPFSTRAIFDHKYKKPIAENYAIGFGLPSVEILQPGEVYYGNGASFGMIFGKQNLSETALKENATAYCDFSNLEFLRPTSSGKAMSQSRKTWSGDDLVSNIKLVYKKTTPNIEYNEFPRQ